MINQLSEVFVFIAVNPQFFRREIEYHIFAVVIVIVISEIFRKDDLYRL